MHQNIFQTTDFDGLCSAVELSYTGTIYLVTCQLALWLWASTPTLSKMPFLDILRNDYLGHFDTFGENFDFDTFNNDTFEKYIFESV